jgi:hypothetical protein
MKNSLYQDILENMRKKSKEELHEILKENDRTEYSDDAFNAIKQVLSEREQKIGDLKTIEEQKNCEKIDEVITSAINTKHSEDERNAAAKILKKLKSDEAVEILLKKLKSKSTTYEERLNIIKALGIISSPSAVEQLSVEIESYDKNIREHAFNALIKINDDTSKKAIEKLSCQVCSNIFYAGREKKSLCPECNRMNKIAGVLRLACLIWFLNSLFFCYYFYIIITLDEKSIQFHHSAKMITLIMGISWIIGFLLLIFKRPIAKGYNIILLIATILFNFIMVGFIGSIFPTFLAILWIAYFIRSKRVKVVYR